MMTNEPNMADRLAVGGTRTALLPRSPLTIPTKSSLPQDQQSAWQIPPKAGIQARPNARLPVGPIK